MLSIAIGCDDAAIEMKNQIVIFYKVRTSLSSITAAINTKNRRCTPILPFRLLWRLKPGNMNAGSLFVEQVLG